MDQDPEITDVREGHRFDEGRLADYLRAQLGHAAGALQVAQMRGGQSNPTFLLRLDGREWVLRKQPPGPILPSAHAVDREYRVLRALHPTNVPVPEPLLFCEDPEVIGTPFYVMERMQGRVFRDNRLSELSPAERGQVYDAMNATLAALHRVDHRAVGLEDFGRAEGFFARQVKRWTKQWNASKQYDVPEIDALAEWLGQNLPQDDEAAICHGDFRLENLMFAPDAPRVIAVFDWELSTIGHPLADLAYNCLPYHFPADIHAGLAGVDLAAAGIPSEDAYVQRYVERTGRREGFAPFHIAFACFRLAVILQGVLARAKAGNAASEDAAEVGTWSDAFAKVGWQLAQQG